MKFETLKLDADLLKAVHDLGFEKPSDIQQKAIPVLLKSDTDFVGQAQTGTGKTAAFVLPLLQKIDPHKKGIQALIMSPTRELANQIQDEVIKLSKYKKISSVAIVGGVSFDRQIANLRKTPQIIVGTPGRIMDMMDRKLIKFDHAEYCILDEADEMLNMGFLEDVQEIIKSFNKKRQMWMFSATMSKSILNLIQKEFRDPAIIKIEKKTLSNEDIDQRYYVAKRDLREKVLCRLIDMEPDMHGLIFCRTRQDTKELADALREDGYGVEMLHGDMAQSQRDYAMTKFKSKRVKLMICTDVAARGIDVSNLSHVINYGVPQDVESYLHRIGRTGRAGAKGISITLIDPRDLNMLRRIQDYTRTQMTKCEIPTLDDVQAKVVNRKVEELFPLLQEITENKKNDTFKTKSFKIFKTAMEGLEDSVLVKMMFVKLFNFEEQAGEDKLLKAAAYEPRHNRSSGRPRPRGDSRGGDSRGRDSRDRYSRGSSKSGGSNYRGKPRSGQQQSRHRA